MNPIYIENQILNKYKSKIFQELIKIIWYENLDDVNEIFQKILKDLQDDINREVDEETVINLIRIIMGLDPIEKIDNINLKDLINESGLKCILQEPKLDPWQGSALLAYNLAGNNVPNDVVEILK